MVVGRIQESLSKAREATFLYELSSALANTRTSDAVAQTIARYLRQLFQASQVNVIFQQTKQSARISVAEPYNVESKRQPDRIIPLLNAWGLVGEIQIWQSEFSTLPAEDSFLLRNFASQAGRAFERAQTLTIENHPDSLLDAMR